ncbi:MAG: glycosyl transferase [Anaerolineae bacterium]|nr:glycosyl transferase [Anaerolineae bacterium]
MHRVLFSVGINAVEALGTVTRMIAIADELRKIAPDTDILFRAAGSEAEHVVDHNYACVTGYKPTMYGLPGWVWKFMGMVQGEWDGTVPPVKGMESIIRLKGICTKAYVEQTYQEWEELVRSFKPDVIVSEFDLVAPIVARKYGIALLTTFSSVGRPSYYSELFYNRPHSTRRLYRPYNRLLRRLKLPEVSNILDLFGGYDHSERLIPSIPAMEDVPANDRNHFVGSIVPEKFADRSWDWDKHRPLIYVYLSIGQITPQLAEKVLTGAFAESDFDVVFSGAGHPYFEKKGEYQIGNVHFFQYLPSDEVMKQADIAIHHGGQNTTLQCIESMVPALIFPGENFERHYNAKKAAEIGCAYNLSSDDFTAGKILSCCQELLDRKPFHTNLEKYSREIRELGGRRQAAAIVLKKLEEAKG